MVKYASRHDRDDVDAARGKAVAFLEDLEGELGEWLFERASLADYALLPFVRQFALVDKAWFDALPLPKLQHWLARFLSSDCFAVVMEKRPLWVEDD